jgi:hypothetical protein
MRATGPVRGINVGQFVRLGPNAEIRVAGDEWNGRGAEWGRRGSERKEKSAKGGNRMVEEFFVQRVKVHGMSDLKSRQVTRLQIEK